MNNRQTLQSCFFFILFISLLLCNAAQGQNVGISSVAIVPDPSSMLEVRATNMGILIPQVALTSAILAGPIANPATSLMVYNTATAGVVPNNVVPGYYYNSGTPAAPVWKKFATGNGDAWQLLGNAGTVDGTNFLGTTDNVPFTIRVNNVRSGRIDQTLGNTFFGYRSGLATTVASLSTFFGFEAGLNANGVGAAGGNNVFVGYQAGRANNTGFNNVFTGYMAGLANTTGYSNTFAGYGAGSTVTSGFGNSLFASSNNGGGGGDIVAGSNNSRFGYGTNWASGDVSGSTYFGYGAGEYIRTGNYNTCIGPETGPTSTTSINDNNTFVGHYANCGTSVVTNATAIGANASVSASNNIILGGNNANAVNVGIGLTATNATSQLHIYKMGALAELLLQSNGHDNAFAGGRILFNNDVIGNAQGNITFVNDAFGSAVMNGGITYFPNAYSINGDGPWANRYSNMAIGTTLFVSDVENGTVIKKVGIGTTTPQNSLDVSNANGLGIAIGTYAGINVAPSGGMIMSGNVGIGTSAPAATNKVEVDYTTTAGTGLYVSSIGNNPWPNIVNGVSGNTLNNSNGMGRGVYGQSTSTAAGSARNWGVWGYASNGGANVGVKGDVTTTAGFNVAVLGWVEGFNPAFNEGTTFTSNYAGYFSGNVALEGALQANGSFGTAGQVLTSNGAGAAYWAAGGGGVTSSCALLNYVPKMTSATNIGCSQIYDNGWNIGIGTTAPGANLEIARANGSGIGIRLTNTDVGGKTYSIENIGPNTFMINDVTAGFNRFTITSAGDVGIGSMAPGAKLEVGGQIKITGGTPGAGKVLTSDAVGLATWQPAGASTTTWSVASDIAYSRDDIAGWTTVLPAGTDDAVAVANLNFTFTINGTAYTQVTLSSNGNIQFGGAGTNALGNGPLPNGTFSTPTVCFYWDDMVTDGNGVRYITVGAIGNRVFIADYEFHTYTGSYPVKCQIQFHEGSNAINIRYYQTDTNACGQSATIGLQINGTTALPISSDTKVLDDNGNPQSISFSPGK